MFGLLSSRGFVHNTATLQPHSNTVQVLSLSRPLVVSVPPLRVPFQATDRHLIRRGGRRFTLSRQCIPSTPETLALYDELAHYYGRSKAHAILGLAPGHVEMWRHKGIKMEFSTRRHVWLVWRVLLRSGSPVSDFELASCGRWTLYDGPQSAGKPLPATIAFKHGLHHPQSKRPFVGHHHRSKGLRRTS